MREQLLGYLLDALDDDEREQVESRLKDDAELQHDLELLQSSLDPLEPDEGFLETPPALADRTCANIATKSTVRRRGQRPAGSGRGWRLIDVLVGGAVVAASLTLVVPALMQGRINSQLAACSDNLRELGVALLSYSSAHDGYFPKIETEGNLSAAGIYSVRLFDGGYLNDKRRLICPGAGQDDESFEIPTPKQLVEARGETLRRYHQTMGGSYGYALGHINQNGYQHTQNRQRTRFALMADVFQPERCNLISGNHGSCGQNVLYEDGRVEFLNSCKAEGCDDDIFHNRHGEIAPGADVDDAVIAHSGARPLVKPVLNVVQRTVDEP